MTWEQTADVLAREVDRLQKENDRLRNGVEGFLIHSRVSIAADLFQDLEQAAFKRGVNNAKSKRWGKIQFLEDDRLLGEILSVKQKVIEELELLRTELGLRTNKEVIAAAIARSKDFPAAEGGGAANGGESRIPTCPLCKKKMVARKVFNSEDNINWVMGVCDSCSVYSPPLYSIDPQKALDAAILGLHTLAGEFPTPTWKTREDYLQATISEINEIIGKQ